jgi:hypothetical protein
MQSLARWVLSITTGVSTLDNSLEMRLVAGDNAIARATGRRSIAPSRKQEERIVYTVYGIRLGRHPLEMAGMNVNRSEAFERNPKLKSINPKRK